MLPAAGMPLKTPVVISKVTPDGSVPVMATVGVGVPVAVTVKVPTVPTVNLVLFALVIVGAVPDGGGGFKRVSPLSGVHALINNIKRIIKPTEKYLFLQ